MGSSFDMTEGLEESLDAMVRLVTPERIVFDHPLGGPFRRLVAHLVDLCLLSLLVLIAVVASLTLSLGTSSGIGPALVAYFLLSWGYGTFCEGVFNGQTPGKRALGLRVVSERGVPITGSQAVLRNLIGTVDGMLPFFYMLGLASMVFTSRFQRLGDLAAGTMVVAEARRPRIALRRVSDPRVRQVLARLPMSVAAGSQLARALSDYVRRRHRFGEELREELAEPLAHSLRSTYGLAPASTADAVLCAFYHRIFLDD